jgi:hypothetical protein
LTKWRVIVGARPTQQDQFIDYMINNEGVGGVEPQHDHRSLLSWALDPAAEKLRNGMYLHPGHGNRIHSLHRMIATQAHRGKQQALPILWR